jgi:hypothetical protein
VSCPLFGAHCVLTRWLAVVHSTTSHVYETLRDKTYWPTAPQADESALLSDQICKLAQGLLVLRPAKQCQSQRHLKPLVGVMLAWIEHGLSNVKAHLSSKALFVNHVDLGGIEMAPGDPIQGKAVAEVRGA